MITTKQELADYIKKRLGEPMICVNVTDEQIGFCISEAIAVFNDYADDSYQQLLFNLEITQDVLDNGYLTVPNSIYEVDKVFNSQGVLYNGSDPLLPNNLIKVPLIQSAYNLNNGNSVVGENDWSITDYTLSMQNLESWDKALDAIPDWDFNKHTHKLYLRDNLEEYELGHLIGIMAKDMILNEDCDLADPTVSELYNNNILKRLCVALVKNQWADNLSKFGGVKMPGGIEFNASEMKQDADKLWEEAKTDLEERYSHTGIIPIIA